jgi:glutaminyl-peptide cyclotransferase
MNDSNIPGQVTLVPFPRMLAVLFLALSATACDTVKRFSGPKTPFNGDGALAYAQAQVNFGPRVPGTAAHRNAGDWIIAQMRARADSVEVQSWKHVTEKSDTLPLRNIIARIRPQLSQRVLYLTHWDTRPVADADANIGARQRPIPGANDGASGVGLFVALADALKKTPPTVGVDLLFVDGEDYGAFGPWEDTTKNKDVLIGSRYFARTVPASYKPLFGALFDMIGDRSLQIYQESNSINGAPEVVARVWETAKELGYAKYFISEVKGPVTDDHLPLLLKGLRVIDVIDYDYCLDGSVDCGQDVRNNLHHTLQDTMDKISAKSLQIVGDVAFTLVTR